MDKSPDAFRTISEVAEDLDLPQHVLRFWETRFSQIKPMKRGGGRRYYRPDDIDLLKGIRHLLYDHGYTIKGVQKLLKQNGPRFAVAIGAGEISTADALASLAKSEPAAAEKPANEVKAPADDPSFDEDQLVGKPKVPAGRRLFSKGPSTPETAQGDMSKDDRALLQEALYDLLECKRLLDQVR